MVNRILYIIALLLVAGAALAETKQFWQMGDVTTVQATDVFLLRRPGFHPYSGARNISGSNLMDSLADSMVCQKVFDGKDGADSTVPGPPGDTGPAGPGVPPGGSDGQVLTKKGFPNYSTHWANPSTTVNWGSITGNIADQPDINAAFEPKNANIQAHISNTSNPHATTASQTGAEPYLGNPPEDGMVPTSTALGVRGWTHAGGMNQAQILTEIAASADGMTLVKRQGPSEADTAPLVDVQKRDGPGFSSVLKATATGVEIRGTLTIY